MDFNSKAKSHPCMKCEHGDAWTEQGKSVGNNCKHPDITKQQGMYYGRFHSKKHIPAWCPLKR